MTNTNPTETISQAGVKHVENWLLGKGYNNIARYIEQDGFTAIEANGNVENILVMIKTIDVSGNPNEVTNSEKATFKARAEHLLRKAYMACVVINGDKNLIGEIMWERIG